MTSEFMDPVGSSAEVASSASARMIERAHGSVVQVRSRGRGAGAGVIWEAEGLVITNYHVVGGNPGGRRIQVILHDGRAFGAEIAKHDRSLDLALLRIRGLGDLPAAPLGDSDALRVGELVFAIGHPWGRLSSATAGIVSSLGVVRGPGGRARYIQSDVSLAPGNSGGPLLNARGEVVGINAMIAGSLGLSIPSNEASTWLAGARERRPRLGVRMLPVDLRGAGTWADRPGEAGFMVVALEPGGPADRAGLLVGDVLLSVVDDPADGGDSLLDAIARAGGTARLRVVRGGVTSEIGVDLRDEGLGRTA